MTFPNDNGNDFLPTKDNDSGPVASRGGRQNIDMATPNINYPAITAKSNVLLTRICKLLSECFGQLMMANKSWSTEDSETDQNL